MKKKLLTILGVGVILLGLAGCTTKNNVSIEELNKVNDKIVSYFKENRPEKYNNYSYNYIDEKNRVVIVGLVDNSKEEQEWFLKNIVNSKYIKFEQGEHLQNESKISNKINLIVNNGPQTSSNPFDYIKASQKEYDELLNTPQKTFEYAINDLIKTNASKGLKSYIEALLCKEINKNFDYDFESANDYLDHYKEFLNENSSILNDYDKYAISLLK